MLKESDREWIRNEESETLAQIETVTVRFTLARMYRRITRAAEVLGMSHGSLSEWFARRDFSLDDE